MCISYTHTNTVQVTCKVLKLCICKFLNLKLPGRICNEPPFPVYIEHETLTKPRYRCYAWNFISNAPWTKMNEIPQLWPEGLKNNLDLTGDRPWINNVNTYRQPFIEVFFCVWGDYEWLWWAVKCRHCTEWEALCDICPWDWLAFQMKRITFMKW